MSGVYPSFTGLHHAVDQNDEHNVDVLLSCFYRVVPLISSDASLSLPLQHELGEQQDVHLESDNQGARDDDTTNNRVEQRDINAKQRGLTALSLAVRRENERIVRLLVEAGADINSVSKLRTPLFDAVVRYNEPIVRLLLLAGADPDRCCTSRNITALQLCVAEGRTPLIEALLAAGASPDIVHPEFGTSVHTATNRNHCVCLRLLCAAGADVNARNADGETPLIVGARRGHLEAVELLLRDPNIDVFAKDFVVGNTALHEAAVNSHEKIARVLLSRYPELAAVRNTLHRQTASYLCSFKLHSTLNKAYSEASRGFTVPIESSSDPLSDIKVESENGRHWPCHRVIVLTRCAALRALYNEQGAGPTLLLPPAVCAAKAVAYVLEFLYTDFVRNLHERSDAVLGQIVRAANQLELGRLASLCQMASARGASFASATAAIATANAPSQFCEDMSRVLESGEFSDVELAVEELVLPLHKFVLCDRSDYFKALLVGGMRETNESRVHLTVAGECGAVALPLVARYLYTRELRVPDNDADQLLVDVFELSNALLLEYLKRAIEAMLVADRITVDNVCQLFDLSNTFQSMYLREEAFDFIVEQHAKISDEDFALLSAEVHDEIERALAFRASEKAAATQSSSRVKKEIAKLKLERQRQRREQEAATRGQAE